MLILRIRLFLQLQAFLHIRRGLDCSRHRRTPSLVEGILRGGLLLTVHDLLMFLVGARLTQSHKGIRVRRIVGNAFV